MKKAILVLGATGMLGKPATHALLKKGHRVRVLTRRAEKARRLFGDAVDVFEGDARDKADIQAGLDGCQAAHINLTPASELQAVQHLFEFGAETELERVTYVSATTAFEQNRWFDMIDIKLRCESTLRECGIPYVIFCPTWVMETLKNFVHGDRAVVITGRNPPPLHFFAASDFGRILADSYDDQRALGKKLFVHGPQAFTLPEALNLYLSSNYPNLKIIRFTLRQAKIFAWITKRKRLQEALQLIDYFDHVREMGDPGETNDLFGAPATTLEEWIKKQKDQPYG